MSTTRDDAAVLTRCIDSVTVITLNRPERLNVIDDVLAKRLRTEVARVGEDRSCRCLVITGSGRAFCAGQALPAREEEALPEDIAGLIRERYLPIIMGLYRLTIPVLAAVNGLATGAGFSLALAADIRIASEAAWFSCGFSKIGLVPDAGATYFLPRLVGISQATRLAFSGERVAALSAQQMGLVASVHPAEDFEVAYLAVADELAHGPTAALARTKQALRASFHASLDQQLELEAQLQQASSLTSDFREGLRAFRERRPPNFRGH